MVDSTSTEHGDHCTQTRFKIEDDSVLGLIEKRKNYTSVYDSGRLSFIPIQSRAGSRCQAWLNLKR